MTKKQFTDYLNDLPIPEDDKKSNGGRIPDTAKYGDLWLVGPDEIIPD